MCFEISSKENFGMEEKSGKSRSFEEITLAITILTGLSFLLFKITDYFSNNIVRYSPDLQLMINFLMMGLLIEMTIISSFLILKGHAISLGKKEDSSINGINWTNRLFKLIFKGLMGLTAFSFALLLVIVLNNLYKNATIPIINYNISYIITSIIMTSILYQVSISIGFKGKIFSSIKKFFNTFIKSKHIALLSIIFVLYLIAPTYLLMGSYSIDVFPQSNADGDILTFTIKETGMPINLNWIMLYELNSTSNFKQSVGMAILNRNNERLNFYDNKFMLGENIYGIWYLKINTSNLQSGTYLLTSEVTNDVYSRFFGTTQKRAEKLFFIPPKRADQSFNCTQIS